MNDYIIIKYYETLIGTSDASTAWAMITAVKNNGKKGPYACRKQDIARKRALELIDRDGLVPVMENKHGKVWDTPDHDFLNKYKGIIETQVD